jgi:GAF domain-containing protein
MRGCLRDTCRSGSYLAIPVVSRSGEVIGGLFFGHSQPGVFTQRDERIVTGIAAQAAIAIDNARLFEASQRGSKPEGAGSAPAPR